MPTYQEEGFPGYVSMAWYGVFARAGTPRPVVDKLNRVFIEIAESKEFSDWVKSKGLFLSVTKTPEEFAAVVKSDAELYSRMIKKLDIPLQ